MFGCAVYENHFNDVQYMNLVTLHCSVLVNENGFKWGIMESVRGEPDWSYLDRLLDIAKVNNRTVKLHNLFWHQQLPNWVNNLTSAELEDAMKRRIQYTAEKLTGIEHLIYGIDVVNEAVDELGLLRNSIFSQKIGIGWVEKAFTWTRQAFGDRVKLIYNDFNTEYGLLKTNSVYSITRDLKQKNLIDEIGFQMHVVHISGLLTFQRLYNIYKRFSDVGLYVSISELDIIMGKGVNPAIDVLNEQGDWAYMIASALLNTTRSRSIMTWGLCDKYSWIAPPRFFADAPLPFDLNCNPKPFFKSLQKAFIESGESQIS